MKRGSAYTSEEEEKEEEEVDEHEEEDEEVTYGIIREIEEDLLRAVSEGDVTTLTSILNLYPIFIETFMIDFHSEENTILFIASGIGNINIVETLLARGADLHQANGIGFTPLFSAAYKGQVAVVMLLLDQGADVNSISNDGYSSLYFASQYGHIVVVSELLGRGANVNHATNFGISSLFIAVLDSQLSVVKLLLEHGADVNYVTNDGYTSLFRASEIGNLQIVEILLEFGADVVMESHSYMPYKIAEFYGHSAVARRLIEVMDARIQAFYSPNIAYFKEFIKAGKLPAPLRQWIPLLSPAAREELSSWVNANIADELSCFAAFFQGPSTVPLRRLTNHQGVVSHALIELLVRRSPATRQLLRDVSIYLRESL